MLVPNVPPWMKKMNNDARVGVDAGEVWTLVEIAGLAGECKITLSVVTAVFHSNDVLDMETKHRVIVLMDPAILTAMVGTLPNLFAEGIVHYVPECWARVFRTFA